MRKIYLDEGSLLKCELNLRIIYVSIVEIEESSPIFLGISTSRSSRDNDTTTRHAKRPDLLPLRPAYSNFAARMITRSRER